MTFGPRAALLADRVHGKSADGLSPAATDDPAGRTHRPDIACQPRPHSAPTAPTGRARAVVARPRARFRSPPRRECGAPFFRPRAAILPAGPGVCGRSGVDRHGAGPPPSGASTGGAQPPAFPASAEHSVASAVPP